MYPELTAAQWLSATYINDDSQLLSAKANERYLAQLKQLDRPGQEVRRPADVAGDRARDPACCKLATAMPPPKDPAKLAELTQIATKMEGMYGAGKYCTGDGDAKTCRQLGELEDVLRSNRDYARAARRLAGLAHHRAADAQGLHALRRTGQRRRARTRASPTPARCGASATT